VVSLNLAHPVCSKKIADTLTNLTIRDS